jgi:hypothetical protein
MPGMPYTPLRSEEPLYLLRPTHSQVGYKDTIESPYLKVNLR